MLVKLATYLLEQLIRSSAVTTIVIAQYQSHTKIFLL